MVVDNCLVGLLKGLVVVDDFIQGEGLFYFL